MKDADYKELRDRLINKAGIQIDRDRVVVQQRELNTFDDGFNTYCRFIIETEYGNYDTMSSKKSYISVNEMNQISNYMKQNIIDTFKGTGLKMIDYCGAFFQKINNQIALKISYTRRLSSNPRKSRYLLV